MVKKKAYMSLFRIKSYIMSHLKEKTMIEDGFVLIFDESLNAYNQYKQLDCLIRLCWDNGKIISCYYSSDFIGHATTDIIFDKIIEKCFMLG